MDTRCGTWAMGLLTLFALAALTVASVLVGVVAWPQRGYR